GAAGQLPGLPALVPTPAAAEGLPALPTAAPTPVAAPALTLPGLPPPADMTLTVPADASPLSSESTSVFIPDSTPAVASEAIANPLMPTQNSAIAVPATMPRY